MRSRSLMVPPTCATRPPPRRGAARPRSRRHPVCVAVAGLTGSRHHVREGPADLLACPAQGERRCLVAARAEPGLGQLPRERRGRAKRAFEQDERPAQRVGTSRLCRERGQRSSESRSPTSAGTGAALAGLPGANQVRRTDEWRIAARPVTRSAALRWGRAGRPCGRDRSRRRCRRRRRSRRRWRSPPGRRASPLREVADGPRAAQRRRRCR